MDRIEVFLVATMIILGALLLYRLWDVVSYPSLPMCMCVPRCKVVCCDDCWGSVAMCETVVDSERDQRLCTECAILEQRDKGE